jgi:hypothetical protein
MSAEYTIEVESRRNLVRIRMGGFFTPEDIQGFLDVRRVAHRELTCGPNEHLTINDIRDMKIQSQDMVDAFRDLLADPAYRSRRLAFVVGPTLARPQVVRALANRHARIFEDFWSAEAWLFGPAEEAEAA